MVETGRTATQSNPQASGTQGVYWARAGRERLAGEYAMVIALVALGGFLRFFQLDLYPLHSTEATYAWQAWQLANGLAAESVAPNPLFLSLQTLLFWLTDGSDFWARSTAALSGVASLGILWLWRSQWGMARTLLTMLLFAISPWQVAIARLGDGHALTLALGLLAVTLVHRTRQQGDSPAEDHPASETHIDADIRSGPEETLEPKPRDATGISSVVLPILAGLLLIGGPLGWNFLLLIGGWIALDLRRAAPIWTILRSGWPMTVGTVVLGVSGWLARPQGIAAISDAPAAWLDQFTNGSLVGGNVLWLGMHFVGDQLLLTLVGLVALLVAAWRGVGQAQPPADGDRMRAHTIDGDPWSERIIYLWAGFGLLLLLGEGRTTATLAFWSAPILIAAGWLFSRVVTTAPGDLDMGETAGVAITLVILLGALWIWTVDLVANTLLDTMILRAILVIGAMILILIALYIFWAGRQHARWLLGCALLVLCLLGSVRGTWLTSFADPVRTGGGFVTTPTHPEVRGLVADLETISAQRAGDPHRMWVQLEPGELIPRRDAIATSDATAFTLRQVRDPVLGWYLRDFGSVVWPHLMRPPQPSEPTAVVSPQLSAASDVPGRAPGGTLARTTYTLRALWTPRIPAAVIPDGTTVGDRYQLHWRTTVRPLARWVLYREPFAGAEEQRVQVEIHLGEGAENTP